MNENYENMENMENVYEDENVTDMVTTDVVIEDKPEEDNDLGSTIGKVLFGGLGLVIGYGIAKVAPVVKNAVVNKWKNHKAAKAAKAAPQETVEPESVEVVEEDDQK